MGDYFQHWLNMGDRLGPKAPRVFYVNWFRKGGDGKFLWPGFGDNARVLKWMCQRVDQLVGARKTPVGLLPNRDDLDLSGLSISAQDIWELLNVDAEAWKAEVPAVHAHFEQFGDRLPERLNEQLRQFKARLA
jgi:phosphoenolpyruvate carboxykinase (GTP)